MDCTGSAQTLKVSKQHILWADGTGAEKDRVGLTKEVGLHFALGFGQGVCEHLGLDGQVLDLEHAHEALDAVSSKHPEQAAPHSSSSQDKVHQNKVHTQVCEEQLRQNWCATAGGSLVFQAEEEAGAARISLPARPAPQLVVYPPRLL